MSDWTCLECGAANPAANLICGSSKCQELRRKAAAAPTANSSSSNRNDSSNVVAVAFAEEGSKALEAKPPSTRKNRYTYTDPQFNSFWEVYPLKRGKAAAARRFAVAVAAGIEPQQIIEAAAAYAVEVEGKEPQFIKWPEGWLSAGRWDDERPKVKTDARYQPYDHEQHLRALEDIR